MTVSQEEPSPCLTQARDLVRKIPACDPRDPIEMNQVQEQLSALRQELREDGAQVEDGLCGLAARMIDLVERHGEINGRQSLVLVNEILGSIVEALGGGRDRAVTNHHKEVLLDNALESGEGSLGLSLMDQRKLGEILVSLSMLTPDQIESALKHQRSIGKRFGETLVELGVLNKASVDCALNMQRRYRGDDPLDPWMQKG